MSIQSMTDQQLVDLYIGGNEKGLEVLLERHKSRIFTNILVVIKDRALAEDVFQETFFKAIQTIKRGQYNEEGKFLPWIHRISRNLIIDHFRRIKKMPYANSYINEDGEELSPLDRIASDDASFETQEIDSKRKQVVRDLIYQLPSDQKEVVIMRMYYDMSFKEIADITNVSINTSLGRMRYALLNLKKMIEEKSLEVVL
ncbi:MAG: sigma-70 family RNA polymerase sigma factor [Bacteroidia bacterium]